jgi:hypothetical protein
MCRFRLSALSPGHLASQAATPAAAARFGDAYLDELYAPPAAQVQAVGFKLMLNQGTRNAAILDYLLARARRRSCSRELAADPRLAPVARQSGTFRSTEKVAAKPVVVALDDLLQRRRWMRNALHGAAPRHA